MPHKIRKCLNSWYKFLNGYQFFCWNEENFDISQAPLYVAQAYSQKKWAFVADYVRFYALYKYGGIYLDTDVLIIKDFTSFVKTPFLCIGRDLDIAPGLLMYFDKRDPFCLEMINFYKDIDFFKSICFPKYYIYL